MKSSVLTATSGRFFKLRLLKSFDRLFVCFNSAFTCSVRGNCIRRRSLTASALLAGVVVFGAPAPAGAELQPLSVEYLPEAMQSATPLGIRTNVLSSLRSDPAVLSMRLGHVDAAGIVQAGALSLALPDTEEVLSLEDLVVEGLESGYGVYTRDRQAGTTVTLVVMGDEVSGSLIHNDAHYSLEALGGGLTAVYRYDLTQLRWGSEAEGTIESPTAPGALQVPESMQDRRDEIDVLVAYTSSAKRYHGNMEMFLERNFLDNNIAYENSEITTRLRLAHSYQTPYDTGPRSALTGPNGVYQDLVALYTRGDGILEEVWEKQDRYKTDLIILFLQPIRNWCWGYAWWWDRGTSGDSVAVAVVAEGCDLALHLFAHEAGHLLGAHHNPEEGRNGQLPNGNWRYGHGLCNAAKGWRTVMAYNTNGRCRPVIPYFSNPDVRYRGTPTGDHDLRDNARLMNERALRVANFRQRGGPPLHTHWLPMVPGADADGIEGFVLVRNRSNVDGELEIHGVDDTGVTFGPARLSIAAGRTAAFNSQDLEDGNDDKDLQDGIGDGTGNWRLELSTALDIEARGYIRTEDGFVTSMHQLAREHESVEGRYLVPFFNPGSNLHIRSWLRVANPNPTTVHVKVEGWDSNGQSGDDTVEFSLGAGTAVLLSSQQLENGDAARFTGRLGDGAGKWRIEVSGGGRPLEIMSLLRTGSGHLTNLSR